MNNSSPTSYGSQWFVLFVALAIVMGCMKTNFEIEQQAFNSDKWKRDSSGAGERSTRSAMLESLINSRKLIGLTRSEVHELLGPPYVGATGDEYGEPEAEWFLAGADRQFGIDTEWVVVLYMHENVSSVELRKL